MRRTTIYLDDEDWQAIEAIKARYGLTRASDAIRCALRDIAFQRYPAETRAAGLQYLREYKAAIKVQTDEQ